MDRNELAYRFGWEYAKQILEDTHNHQNGPGMYHDNEEIPDGDYVELRRVYGVVTDEMERSYRAGYNASAGGAP